MSVAYVLDEIFEGHRPPFAHPERPDRLRAIREALVRANIQQRGLCLPVRPATDEELGRVHSRTYLDDLVRRVPGNSGWLDGDTYFAPGTWDAALAAAGGLVDLTQGVLSGQFRCGMAFVRPPGHHAEADRAMGFCLLNNVAVGAAAARASGASRVAIVDWDVHHGNGTQQIFYEDPSVMYLSCHQFPYFPGTGAPEEVGRGAGAGTTINVGLPQGCGDREYELVFQRMFIPRLHKFRPDLIMVSAGFDAHMDDPLAKMRVSKQGFAALATQVRAAADELCDGRLVCTLEGGYDLSALARSVVAVVDVFDREGAAAHPHAGVKDDDVDLDIDATNLLARALTSVRRTEEALAACGKG
jgi:acetoin utilization deacetylase AcuC-like enzyme